MIEAVVENFAEYKDYNTTTTQSDHGELLYVLLDFLRLKAGYQRFAWNIKPVVVAHDVLVRRGRTSAAELWRRAVAERTAEPADWHLARLAELETKYRVRLATVSDRLAQRFVRPLAVDRLRALVRPAIDDARRERSGGAFALLEQELAEFVERPSGSGLDVPGWLAALEHEAAVALAGEDSSASNIRPVGRHSAGAVAAGGSRAADQTAGRGVNELNAEGGSQKAERGIMQFPSLPGRG